jgi:hypothetical protein
MSCLAQGHPPSPDNRKEASMSEIQSSGSVNFDGSEPSSGVLGDFTAPQATTEPSHVSEARAAAVSAYLESKQQYGGGRSLYAPEGRYQSGSESVRYRYAPQTPSRRSYRTYQSGRQSSRRASRNWARPYQPKIPSGPYAKGENTNRGPGLLAWLLARLGLS